MAIDFKRKLSSNNALMLWKICLQINFMKNGKRKKMIIIKIISLIVKGHLCIFFVYA
jgi:hypothetical protein